jgi:hypothetical protein
MELFNRQFIFQFIQKGTRTASEKITNLDMTFEIEKNLTEFPNVARLTMINLNPRHRDMLEDPETYCQLDCGYGTKPMQIFAGAISDAYSHKDGTEVITEIEVRDGFLEWRDEITSISFSPHQAKAATLKKNVDLNSTAKNIINFIGTKMGLPVAFDAGVPDYTFKNGFSYYGSAREALARVCKAAGYRWAIQSSVIRIMPSIWSITDSGIVIAGGAGMVGSPERLRRSAKQSAKVKDEETGKKINVKTARPKFDGWRITSLLRPELEPGDYFICRSTTNPFTTGKTLKATNVRHAGGNDDQPWYTQVEADEEQ